MQRAVSRDQSRSNSSKEAIAIVGVACRLPGAPDFGSLGARLLEGHDAVTEIPDDRWSKPLFFHPEPGQRGKAYTFAAGVLDEIYGFDPGFFGIAPREAAQMDPQQRLLLELAHETIEDAGLNGSALAGTPIGVYVGGSSWDYLNLHIGDPSVIDAYSMTGATLCSLSNRISYAFDLHGPSLTVDTACSSSLVALHLACEAIRAGRVPAALVGGVNLLLAPHSYVGFSQASMLSRTGRCHAFDARADGYVRAEGGGMVMLKTLSAALADGDRIRAVVRATGTNSDGRTTGLSLPSQAAQAALLRDTYARFGIEPDEIDYLEAHGTGTPAGDPIEAGALGAVLGQARSTPLPIGSVKTNLGHLEAGSGMAGLLKALVVLQTGVIPRSLHCATPNPLIPFERLNLELVPRNRPLRANGHLPAIGINSFGFGGTNAHAVLGTAPLPAALEKSPAAKTLPPLLLSARSQGALRGLAEAWRAKLAEADLDSAAAALRGLARRREHHPLRLAALGASPAALADVLDRFVSGKDGLPVASGTATEASGPAFVFSGNGSQWAGMGMEASQYSAAFRAGLRQVDAALQPLLGWSVRDRLARLQDARQLEDTSVSQPLLFAVQVAAVEALRAHGIRPVACMGHSVGEVSAAWAAGALTLPQAARVIHARSHHQRATHGTGAMAVLGLPIGEAWTAAAAFGIEIAAENASASVTVAGPESRIDALAAEAARRRWPFTRLDLAYAFHSAAMDPIQAPLLADLKGLTGQAAEVPFVSTVTGGIFDGAALGETYWWNNVRRPVRFAEAARTLIADGVRLFLEIGPQPVLQAYLHEALRQAEKPGEVFAVLSRRKPIADPFALAAIRCHVAGADISRTPIFEGPVSSEGLPTYPWQRETFRLERTDEATDLVRVKSEHALLGLPTGTAPDAWISHLGVATAPWLADHVVGGSPVLPAAAIIDMMLAASRARHPDAAGFEIADLEISRAMSFDPGQMRVVCSRVREEVFTLESRPRLSGEPWSTHASGRIGPTASATTLRQWKAADAAPNRLSGEALYDLAGRLGLAYGPAFRTVVGIDVLGDTEALVTLRAATAPAPRDGLIDATLLDGALQGLLALAARHPDVAGRSGMLPWRFSRVRLLDRAGVPATALLRITQVGPRAVSADILLRDGSGAPLAELLECWFVAVSLGQSADPARRCFHVETVIAADANAAPPDPGLLVAALETVASPDAASESGEMAGALADAYVTVRAHATLRTIGADQVSPEAAGLLDELLGWLEADGLAERRGAAWTLAGSPDLPPAEDLLRSLLFDIPAASADAALLAVAADTLDATLRDVHCRPAPPPALLDQFLYHSPAGQIALAALADAAAAVARNWPAGRLLRVLEIGAGRGTASRVLIPRLRAACAGVSYVAVTTHDEHAVLSDVVAEFNDAVARVWVPGAESPALGSFDLVIGMHGLTRARLDGDKLAVLRDVLAPGGLLLTVEPLPNRVWSLIGVPGLDGSAAMPHESSVWLEALAAAGMTASPRLLAASLWPAVLIGARAPATTCVAAMPPTGLLLLMASPDDPLAEALAAELRGRGVPVSQIPEDAVPQRDGLVEAAGVVLLVPVSAPDDIDGAAAWLGRAAALTSPLAEAALPLWLVTRGTAAGEPFAAAFGGLRRVLVNEAPGIRSRDIRLALDLAVPDAAAHLADEVLAGDAEQEVRWDATGRRVPRIRLGLPSPPPVAEATEVTAVLAIERPGLLGSLRWQRAGTRSPGRGEVAISVRAAGLNFRDVMWAMGLLPDEALLHGFAGPTIGLECAGVVTGLGPDVTDLAIGDAVMAFAPASLGTDVVTRRHAVARLPAGMDFTAGATIPVAFFTVVYALGELARLEPGERVLIHGAAGGVGLAAIQYAHHRGAVVFASAGSPTKRALLRQLGVEHVLDSRSLAFADDVMMLTGGEGVDVVLNSLSGEAMERSLGLLRPFGRFLELGKRDFYRNTAVGIRPLRHNASYFAIDADQLPLHRPALATRLLGEIVALLEAGALRPLPYRAFDFAEVVDAFRLMQTSGHLGKIVLRPGAVPLPLAPPPMAEFAARADGTYLVTGGLTGFGLETARWLVRRGARHLALLGRRGIEATPGAKAALAGFVEMGVEARGFAVDVTDAAAVASMLDDLRATMPPLRGVVHAAMTMDDAFLPALDEARFAGVLRPKWGGAANLDALTRTDPVELFLMFSSITTTLGNPGQANYVAANAALEAIAERRHAAGLPALAVGWGPIADAGYLVDAPDVSEALRRRLGSAHLLAAEALDALPAMLAAGVPVVHYSEISGLTRRGQLPLLASPLFEAVAGPAAQGDEDQGADLRALVAGRTPNEARRSVAEALAVEVAAILQLPVDRVNVPRPLADLGMDSLMALELRLAVEKRFGVSLPLFSLSEGITLAGMAARLVDPLLGVTASDAAPAVSQAIARYEMAIEEISIPMETRTDEAEAGQPVAARP